MPVRFAALRTPWYKGYLVGGSLAMTADHVEHAISYFVMWQLFESPVLAGFAVVSHWVPHLLFSIPIGALADRVDCRRLVQAGQLAFMVASAGWAYFFFTDSLEPWHCIVLLLIHGFASALWSPPEQMLIYDINGPATLPSALRLHATGLNLGMLLGPAIGAVLLATVGPAWGMLLNIAIYLPFTLYLFLLPYTGHSRADSLSRPRAGFREIFSVVPQLPRYPAVLVVIALQGAAGLFIGTALLPLLPEFGRLLGVGEAGVGYGLLLVAMSTGAVLGGVGLEAIGGVRPTTRLAVGAGLLFATSVLLFSLSPTFGLSLLVLVLAGLGNLVANATAQTIVQLEAPTDRRGAFIGAFGVANMGFRSGSGILVAGLGTLVGVTGAITLNAGILVVIAATLLVITIVNRRTRVTHIPDPVD